MSLRAGLLASCLALCGQAHADVVNGGFETGTLAGWYSSGTTAIAAAAPYAPLAGLRSALVVAMSTAPVPPNSCATDVWNINCPQPLPFASSGVASLTNTGYQGAGVGNAFFRGGYIGQDLSVQSGDRLNWSWTVLGEAAGGSVDGARFYATNGIVESVIDARANIQTYSFSSGGLWTIYFGVFQTEDPFFYSALLVDSVRVSAIPESSSLALMSLGLLSLTALRRRRG
jgi:hypothetical protein